MRQVNIAFNMLKRVDNLYTLADDITLITGIKNDDLNTHCIRVGIISKRIGQRMGLTENEANLLFLSGFLHDVGKRIIPSSILFKPTKLNTEEWDIIKQHPIASEKFVLSVGESWNNRDLIANAVRHHHEDVNGCGYPDNLKGDEIPLYSKIISIADYFDAISTSRPYRSGVIRNPIETMEEIVGSKFDTFIFNKYAYDILREIEAQKVR